MRASSLSSIRVVEFRWCAHYRSTATAFLLLSSRIVDSEMNALADFPRTKSVQGPSGARHRSITPLLSACGDGLSGFRLMPSYPAGVSSGSSAALNDSNEAAPTTVFLTLITLPWASSVPMMNVGVPLICISFASATLR